MSEFSYTVTAVNAEEQRLFAEAVLAKENEILIALPSVPPRFFVYGPTGRPWFGRDTRGRYWQRRVDGIVARRKRAYDKRQRAMRKRGLELTA